MGRSRHELGQTAILLLIACVLIFVLTPLVLTVLAYWLGDGRIR